MTLRRIVLLAAVLLPALASAQTFEFQKPPDVKDVEWNVQAKAGLLLSGGNSQSISFSMGGTASRKWADNRLLIEGGIAYARSQLRIAQDLNGNGTIDSDAEVATQTQTTTNAWNAAGRYDRFFGNDQNSAYVQARFSADYPAGKDLLAGGQIGYSRLLFKSDAFETLAEVGYDYTSEKDAGLPAVSIHSLREYLQQTFRISPTSNFVLKGEALENLNSETAPYQPDNSDTVPAFGDLRVNASATLNVTINTHFSIALGETLRYDHAPALRPPFKGIAYAADYRPFADKLDSLTEAALVVTVL